VVKFRPRTDSRRNGNSADQHGSINATPNLDLRRYEQDSGPDDYRHRMIVNAAGLVVAILLVVGGVWIANTMAEQRKNQDCVLSGRRACAPIATPIEPR
jgi:hypothetical protein